MIIDDKLMKYVVFQKRTESEIRLKCKKLEYTSEYIDEIIEYLKENEYINDEKYVEKYMNNVMRLKKSSIYEMRIGLLKKGVDEDYIDQYVSANYDMLYEYEQNSAKQVIMKKIKSDDLEKVKRYLKGKGYLYSSIACAIESLDDDEQEE